MEDSSVVEEPTILEDASEASTTTIDLVNDKVIELTTLGAFFSYKIMRITNDLIKDSNALDDAKI